MLRRIKEFDLELTPVDGVDPAEGFNAVVPHLALLRRA